MALLQTRLVEEALHAVWPDIEVVREIIRTSGDDSSGPIADRKAGRKGLFTREIENRLLVRQIDLAVHSAKDLPSEMPDELEICATLPRANTEDVLLTKNGERLATLPVGAIVATGSVRRQHQLRRVRPDLQIVELRGNVPTRVRKLHENESWSGIVLARAGIERLGLELPMEILSPHDFVPAGGQGIIALQIRRDDDRTRKLLAAVDDLPTMLMLRAEREFLRLLQGDCNSPIGVQASLVEGKLHLRAQIFAPPKTEPKSGERTGAPNEPETIARELMQLMYG